MKRIYLLSIAWLTVLGMSAQEETDISREITIEKSYSPHVDDAAKTVGVPETVNPLVERPLAEYSSWAIPLTGQPKSQPLLVSALGEEKTFEKQRGYAQFGMGNYLNINADAGIRLIDNKKNQLGIWYNHFSTGGKLKYFNSPEWIEDKSVYQHSNINTLNTTYKHLFDNVEWSTRAAYRHNKFNYYGFKLQPLPIKDGTEDQKTNQYAVATSVRSIKDRDVIFDASIGFEGYNNAVGYMIGSEGIIENHIETKLALTTKTGSKGHRIGFDVKMDNLFYNRIQGENYTQFSFTPFYKYANDKIRFKAGVKIDISANDGTVLRFAPDVKFNLDFGKSFHLYTTITGGKELNTLSKVSAVNMYVNPSKRLSNTYTPVNGIIGLYCNYFPNFTGRVYVGIKSSVSALFDARYNETIEEGMITSLEVIDYMPIDAYRWESGFNIDFKLNKVLKGDINWKLNSWHGRDDGQTILSSLPRNEWNISLDVFPIKNLSINTDFYIGTGRGYRYDNENGIGDGNKKLSDIYNLSIGVNYSINKLIHVYLQGNNLISQHYDIYYGMPAQRINFLLGAGVNF